MKKFFLIIIFTLTFNNLNAGYGSGELKLSSGVVNAFYQYLTNNKGNPLRFAVSQDGQWSYWFYCAYAQCVSDGDVDLVRLCERKATTSCSTFAVGRSVKWKNGINPGGKNASFKKNMTFNEVKDKLTKLGFID